MTIGPKARKKCTASGSVEGAKALGLEGIVSDKAFDALRQNRHPKTGEPLTARDSANRVAFFDIQPFRAERCKCAGEGWR